MRVKTAILFISIVGLCLFSSICLAGTYSGGDGTTENPYQISDVNDFLELSATSSDWSNYFILTADIDLSGLTYSHAAIAWDTHYDDGFQGIPFTGVFNGNEHIIRNFKNDVQWGSDYHGLFGRIEGSSAAINNLGLEDVYIKGKYGYQFYGGLCGENRLGSISNCYVTGRVGGSIYTGGLCGSNSGGQINNCYSTAIVTARIYTGGLCGYNGESGGISHCYSNASVSGGDYVGGLCGMNSSSTITNCYSMGSVTS
ncbi:MAG: hypothetical protein H8E62_06265, partial [Planctomycetes bacterium]|nr:hypothetical protein [Planctomycetota bacterium]